MGFLVHQLEQLVIVFVIMVCALFGTVGIIKLIKQFFPFIDLPQNVFCTDEKDKNNRNDTEGGNSK